jgi:hypothetical protein
MPSLFSAASINVRDQLLQLLDAWKELRSDGKFTVLEFVDFSRKAIQSAMAIVDGLKDNATKKALVMEFAGLLFDAFAPLIIGRWPFLVWVLAFFGGADVVKLRYLEMVSLLIEALVARKA